MRTAPPQSSPISKRVYPLAPIVEQVAMPWCAILSSRNVRGLFLGYFAFGGGAIYVSQSGFWSVTADIARRHMGVVSGPMNVGCQVGGAITTSLTPWIAAQYDWVAAFGFGAVIVLAGTLVLAVVDPNRLIEPAPNDDLGTEPAPVAV